MKDYFAGNVYTQIEKDLITKLAQYLYIRFGVGRKNDMGWNVCNDEDREKAIQWSKSTYSEIIKPYVVKITEDTKVEVKREIIEKIKSLM